MSQNPYKPPPSTDNDVTPHVSVWRRRSFAFHATLLAITLPGLLSAVVIPGPPNDIPFVFLRMCCGPLAAIFPTELSRLDPVYATFVAAMTFAVLAYTIYPSYVTLIISVSILPFWWLIGFVSATGA